MQRLVNRLSYGLAYVSGAALIAVTILMSIDVAGRYLFSAPLTFAVESIELLMGLAIAFGLAVTTYRRGHIRVDLVTHVAPPGLKVFLDLLADLASIVFFALIAWKLFDKAGQTMRDGLFTQILSLPIYPVVYLMSAGAAAALLAVVVLVFRGRPGGGEG